MHENIKFTVRLSEHIKSINKDEILLTRILPKPDPEKPGRILPVDKETKAKIGYWQPIFGDVKYGTDHVIYSKFCGVRKEIVIDKQKKKKKVIFEVDTIQLYIQNYAGPVTIGFNQQDVKIYSVVRRVDDMDGDTRYPGRTEYVLVVGLEALKRDLNDLFMLDQSSFKVIDNDTEPPSESDIKKAPLKLENGDTLRVETWYSPADPRITHIFENKEKLKSAAFVDEQFMERVGEDIVVTHRGLAELKWIRKEYKGFISAAQYRNAQKNKTVRPRNYISTRAKKSDFRPCQDTYSLFCIINDD